MLLALILVVCFEGYNVLSSYHMSGVQQSSMFVIAQNDTLRYNLTVKVLSCDGSSLVEDNLRPKVKIIGANITSSCTAQTCTFDNLPEGNYEINIYWRDVLVNKTELSLTKNTTLTIYAEVAKVSLKVLDDNKVSISSYSVEVSGPGGPYIFEKGDKYFLPYGTYTYIVTYKWGDREYTFSGSFTISSCVSKAVELELPIANSISIYFVRRDGSPLGKIEGWAKIIDEEKNFIIEEVFFNETNSIKIDQIPYGRYIIRCFLRGKEIYETRILITESGDRDFKISLDILKTVVFRILDRDNMPFPDTEISISTPTDTFRLTTGPSGDVSLENVMPGTFFVKMLWRDLEFSVAVNVNREGSYDVILPFHSIEIAIRSAGSSTIPSGSSLRFYYGSIVLVEKTAQEEEKEIRVRLEKIPMERINYKLVFEVNGTVVLEKKIYPDELSEERVTILVPFYDLNIRVKTLDGNNLGGCKVEILSQEYARSAITDGSGTALFKHLFDKDYTLKVYWKNILVFNRLITRSELHQGYIEVIASVKSYRVDVSAWLGRKIKGANTTLILKLSNGKTIEFSDLTDSSGSVVFTNIPIPGGSSLELVVRYGNLEVRRLVDPAKETDINVFMDVLLDIAGQTLTLMETLILVIMIIAASAIGVMIYRRIRYVKEIKSMFSEGVSIRRENMEEIHKESLIDRIRDFIKELRGKKEEEEEWDIFG